MSTTTIAATTAKASPTEPTPFTTPQGEGGYYNLLFIFLHYTPIQTQPNHTTPHHRGGVMTIGGGVAGPGYIQSITPY